MENRRRTRNTCFAQAGPFCDAFWAIGHPKPIHWSGPRGGPHSHNYELRPEGKKAKEGKKVKGPFIPSSINRIVSGEVALFDC